MTTQRSDQAPAEPSADDYGVFGSEIEERDAKVVLLPVPFEGTAAPGARSALAPAAIRMASWRIEPFDLETGRPYEAGIFMRRHPEAIAALNREAKRTIETAGYEEACAVINTLSERAGELVYRDVRALLDEDKLVGLVGGDHSVSFGSIRAHAEKYGELGILQIDAHSDLREPHEGFECSHASIMDRVLRKVSKVTKLVQVGIREVGESELAAVRGSKGRISALVDPLIARARDQGKLTALFREAVEQLPEQVYVSFDVDGLDPKLCTNTATPVPGGLMLSDVSLLLEQLALAKKRVAGFDLVEVAPGLDGGEWDADVGARLLYKLIGWALISRGFRGIDRETLWEQLRNPAILRAS